MSGKIQQQPNLVQNYWLGMEAGKVRHCFHKAAEYSQSSDPADRHLISVAWAAVGLVGNFFNAFLYLKRAPLQASVMILNFNKQSFYAPISFAYDIFSAARCLVTTALGVVCVALALLFPKTIFGAIRPVDVRTDAQLIEQQKKVIKFFIDYQEALNKVASHAGDESTVALELAKEIGPTYVQGRTVVNRLEQKQDISEEEFHELFAVVKSLIETVDQNTQRVISWRGSMRPELQEAQKLLLALNARYETEIKPYLEKYNYLPAK